MSHQEEAEHDRREDDEEAEEAPEGPPTDPASPERDALRHEVRGGANAQSDTDQGRARQSLCKGPMSSGFVRIWPSSTACGPMSARIGPRGRRSTTSLSRRCANFWPLWTHKLWERPVRCPCARGHTHVGLSESMAWVALAAFQPYTWYTTAAPMLSNFGHVRPVGRIRPHLE